MLSGSSVQVEKESTWHIWLLQVGLGVVSIFLFLIALELMTTACSHLGAGFASNLVGITTRPVVSLFIGLLLTAVIQSSSTLTSILVAMVAANSLSLVAAVPFVLGANIGTTVTSVIVALANLGTPKAFRRGFTVACSHVIFNVATTILLFFLEDQWKILSGSAAFLAHKMTGWNMLGQSWASIHRYTIDPPTQLIQTMVAIQPVTMLGFSLILLFVCISMLTFIFKWMILGKEGNKGLVGAFGNPLISLISGTGITAAIHSSSATTSLAVMLAASEKIPPRKLFPFVLGANVGTTVTALLAAMGKSEPAIAIALCHLIFNTLGVLLFYPIPAIRALLLKMARSIALSSAGSPVFAFAFLLILFYLLPFTVIFISARF